MSKFFNWADAEGSEQVLYIEGPIDTESWFGDETTPDDFKAKLDACTGTIRIHINSPGGDCVAASMIYTMLMDYNRGDIIVQIDGMAASAASVIAMAGTTVTMSPTAMMMIHNPLTAVAGNAEDMRHAADVLEEYKESIINAYEIKTGLSRVKLAHMMDDETWMSAYKAKELGFCDEVLFTEAEALPIAASANYSFSRVAALTDLQRIVALYPAADAQADLTEPAEPEPEPAEPETEAAETEAEQAEAAEVPDTTTDRVSVADLDMRLAKLRY